MKHWYNHPDNSGKTLLLQLSIASKTEGFSLNCANKCLDSLHFACVDTFYNNIYNLHTYKGETFQHEKWPKSFHSNNFYSSVLSNFLIKSMIIHVHVYMSIELREN